MKKLKLLICLSILILASPLTVNAEQYRIAPIDESELPEDYEELTSKVITDSNGEQKLVYYDSQGNEVYRFDYYDVQEGETVTFDEEGNVTDASQDGTLAPNDVDDTWSEEELKELESGILESDEDEVEAQAEDTSSKEEDTQTATETTSKSNTSKNSSIGFIALIIGSVAIMIGVTIGFILYARKHNIFTFL